MGFDPTTYSEAVNSWLLLVVMLLMGKSCPWRSPRGVRVSACQRRSRPPRQPPTTTGDPGTRLRALAQSPGLLTHCWEKGHRTHDPRVSGRKGREAAVALRGASLETPLERRKTLCQTAIVLCQTARRFVKLLDALSNARHLVKGKTPCQRQRRLVKTQDAWSNR